MVNCARRTADSTLRLIEGLQLELRAVAATTLPCSFAEISTTMEQELFNSPADIDTFGVRNQVTPPPKETLLGEGGAGGAGGATGVGGATGAGGGVGATLVSFTTVGTTGLGVGFASTTGATTLGVSAFFTSWIFSTFFGGGGNGFSTILTSFGFGGSFFGSGFGFGGNGFGASCSFTLYNFYEMQIRACQYEPIEATNIYIKFC